MRSNQVARVSPPYREMISESPVGPRLAARLYKADVRASQFLCDVILQAESRLTHNLIWPPVSGLVHWCGATVYYEPLLVPLNEPLRFPLRGMLDSRECWDIARGFILNVEADRSHNSKRSPLQCLRSEGVDGLFRMDSQMARYFDNLAQLLNVSHFI